MDNDTKLIMFLETMGNTIDVEVARSLLEVNDWNLEAALNMAMTTGTDLPSRPAPPRPVDADGYRAPMRTGYHDTLMGPANPALERELAEQRRQEEELARLQEEERRKAAELAAQQQREEQVRKMRQEMERRMHEMRSQEMSAHVAQQRLDADPEAKRQLQEQKEREEREAAKKAEEEAMRKEQEELRKKKEAEKAAEEAEERRRRRESKELEEIEREKIEAERRRLAAEAEAAESSPKEVDAFKAALLSLLGRYKETDASGLTTCLKTLRTYIDNLARNPLDPRFQRINCENSAFRTRVAAFEGARDVLIACGYREEEGALAVDPDFAKNKGPRLWDALSKIDVVLNMVDRG
mmetsp:Transcript_33806/g.63103  ORF Transcript_33806/g.63103 Transcript_33806/m.63103 type:complete len:353 (-) Transcript_33806:114-1172(-)